MKSEAKSVEKRTAKPDADKAIVRKPMDAEVMQTYLPLVNTIASIVASRGLPPNVQFDDLVSDGTVGLMKAWDNFDTNRGVKFETYASYRVRGEILDGLKLYNPVPYRVQLIVRDFAKRREMSAVEEEEGKKPKKKKSGVSATEFETELEGIQKVVAASALMYLLSLESIEGEAEVPGGFDPDKHLEFGELRKRLEDAVQSLSETERDLVDLFYAQDYNQKEIAEKLGLSKSKVHRLHGKILVKLKEKLKSHV